MATMRDVAKDAGVSVATVSRYINQSGYISQEAEEKIKTSIKKLDYYPNEVARSLFKQSSKLIGVLVPDIKNPYFNELVKSVEETLLHKGYLMVLADISESDEKLGQYSKLFSQYNVSGLLVSTGRIIDYKNLEKVPKVYMDRLIKPVDHYVITDDFYGGKLVGEHLNETQMKSVLLIKGPESLQGSHDRFSGIINTLKDGCHLQDMTIKSYEVDYLKRTASEIAANLNRIDTIVCANDFLAIQIIKACNQKQIQIPKEVQVIAYDGIPAGDYISPGLTTVKQPVEDIGRKAVEILVNQIERGKEIESQTQIKLKPSLVIRESTRWRK